MNSVSILWIATKTKKKKKLQKKLLLLKEIMGEHSFVSIYLNAEHLFLVNVADCYNNHFVGEVGGVSKRIGDEETLFLLFNPDELI